MPCVHSQFYQERLDENDNIVETATVGNDPCYVVDDMGFRRHIPSEHVDRQVLERMAGLIEGHEDILIDQAAKMLGQDDIFSRAMIEKQFQDIDKQFDNLLETGIPEEVRAYMGMMGFKTKTNSTKSKLSRLKLLNRFSKKH